MHWFYRVDHRSRKAFAGLPIVQQFDRLLDGCRKSCRCHICFHRRSSAGCSPFPYLSSLAVITAFMLILSQGMMVFRATAVKAWNQKLIPAALCDIRTDDRLWLFSLEYTGAFRADQAYLISIFLFIIFSNLLFWLFYLFGRRDNDFKQTVKFLRRPLFLILIVVVGHIIPFAHVFFLFLITRAENPIVVGSFGFNHRPDIGWLWNGPEGRHHHGRRLFSRPGPKS